MTVHNDIRNERQRVILRLNEITYCRDDEFTERLVWALFDTNPVDITCSDITRRIITLIDSPCNKEVVSRLEGIIGCPSFVYGGQLYRALFGQEIGENTVCTDFSRRIAELIGDTLEDGETERGTEERHMDDDDEPGPCPQCGGHARTYIGGIRCEKCGFHVTRHRRTNAETIHAWREGILDPF